MMHNAVEFAKGFKVAMLEHMNLLMSQPWTDESRVMLKYKIRSIAYQVASKHDVHPDAADAIAQYAIDTVVLDGVPLEEATLENLMIARRTRVSRL